MGSFLKIRLGTNCKHLYKKKRIKFVYGFLKRSLQRRMICVTGRCIIAYVFGNRLLIVFFLLRLILLMVRFLNIDGFNYFWFKDIELFLHSINLTGNNYESIARYLFQ